MHYRKMDIYTVKYVNGDSGRSDIRQCAAVVSAVFLVGICYVQSRYRPLGAHVGLHAETESIRALLGRWIWVLYSLGGQLNWNSQKLNLINGHANVLHIHIFYLCVWVGGLLLIPFVNLLIQYTNIYIIYIFNTKVNFEFFLFIQ